MTRKELFSLKISIFCLLGAVYTPCSKASDLKVSLFGQPCTLSGNHSIPTLQSIHSISPEQMPWPQSVPQINTQLQKLKEAQVPAALSHYQKQMSKRLSAWKLYLEALKQPKISLSVFLEKTTSSLSSRRLKDEWTKSVKTLNPNGLAPEMWDKPTLEKLRESYLSFIETDPQEEFHRALNKIRVRYICTFEESSEDSEENDEEQ